MIEWAAKLLELVKLPTKLMAVLCLVSGILLLLPRTWLQIVHLTQFSSDYGVYIGVAFLVSGTALVVELVVWSSSRLHSAAKGRRLGRMALDELNRLDPKEVAVLREFFLQNQSALSLPVSHPVVASLIDKGILEQVGRLGEHSLVGPLVSLRISPTVRPHVTLSFVGLHDRTLTPDEIAFVRENRPEFVDELERRRQRHYRFPRL